MRFRKKPVVIDAMQMAEDTATNRKVAEWIVDHGYRALGYDDTEVDPEEVDEMYVYGDYVLPEYGENFLTIPTLEGDMNASPGDWIIRGIQGEFYPCKPDIFEQTYEAI